MSRRYIKSGRYINRPYAWRTVVRDLRRGTPKIMVEACLALSIKELFDEGLIEEGSRHAGSWRYTDRNTFQFDGPIQYEADLRDHEKAWLRLRYDADGVKTDHCILLASTTRLNFGGRRWYFRCPLHDIRVTKLYLPPGARQFASRQAHELIHRCHSGSRRRRSSEGGGWFVVIETSKLGTS